jgi:hypothetical protein
MALKSPTTMRKGCLVGFLAASSHEAVAQAGGLVGPGAMTRGGGGGGGGRQHGGWTTVGAWTTSAHT